VEFAQLSSSERGESSATIRARVNKARQIQLERYRDTNIFCNSQLTPAILHDSCPVSDKGMALLKKAFDKLGLSARGYDRILKVSRTIADLSGDEIVDADHIAEAVQFRSLDRKYWHK
jgi:magnesium chelatase family protein